MKQLRINKSGEPSNVAFFAVGDGMNDEPGIGFKLTIDGVQYGDILVGEPARQLAKTVLGWPNDLRSD